ncbi:hypothetical protein M1L60_08965 [Actinoplanes sp. TRM 88003]|uniref:DUF4352 domain-containing protein n=1 Tax=Paractinoplanes aksuensis TaxID=2939490 RepID=A0ABT1DL26_9ACTN|nr:hypothetical protein [Actinoplanes aksuensis]MCO8270730.1 hypothetical protein [Actinoplanes aksuensis]
MVGITAVAVHIHQPSDDEIDYRRTAPSRDLPRWQPNYDPLPYVPTPAPPTWIPPDNPLPTTQAPTSPPAAVPVGGVLPSDVGVIMKGDSGEQMELRLVRIANPAPAVDPDNPSGAELQPRLGYRLVSITVQVKNTGGVPFLTDIEKHTWLVDRAGNTYTRNVKLTEARQLHPASQLNPDSWNSREIVFEVRGGADLTRFRLSTHPGAAAQTQDWRLS